MKFIMPTIVIVLSLLTVGATLKIFVFDRRAKSKPARAEPARPGEKEHTAMDAETLGPTNQPSQKRSELASDPILDPSDVVRTYSNRMPAQAQSGTDLEARTTQTNSNSTNRTSDLLLDPTAVIESLSKRPSPQPSPSGSSTSLTASAEGKLTEEVATPAPREEGRYGGSAAPSEPSARDKAMEARAMFARAANLYRSGDLIMAEVSCEKVLRESPDAHWAHNLLGEIYARQQKWSKAIGKFEEAVKLDPTNSEYHNNLGLIYGNIGKTDLSEEHLLKANKLNPLDVTVLMNCSWHYRKLKKYPEALKYLDLVLAINPENPQARTKRFQTLLDLGEFAKVEEGVKALIATKPDMQSYMILAASRSRQGDASGAVEWLQKAEHLTTRESMLKLLEKINDFDAIKDQPQYKDYVASLK